MLQRYDQDAMLRAMKWEGSLDEDLECAYLQTDAMMADAKIAGLPPIFFDARMRRNATTGLTVEFRRCLLVPRDLVATSHAYWQFVPHHRFSEFFVFDHVRKRAWPVVVTSELILRLLVADCELSRELDAQLLPLPVQARRKSDSVPRSVPVKKVHECTTSGARVEDSLVLIVFALSPAWSRLGRHSKCRRLGAIYEYPDVRSVLSRERQGRHGDVRASAEECGSVCND